MNFEKIEVPSQKELIIQQIESKIISGELAADSKLPTERELAQMLGVSKSVMHFALKELEQLKFLRTVPRHGTYVNNWTSSGSFETLNQVLKLQGAQIEPHLKDSLIRLRNTIESDSMKLCVQNCTQADFAEIQAEIDRLAATPEDMDSTELAKIIMQFHYLIIEKSGNLIYPILMRAFNDFALLIWKRCVEFWTKERIIQLEQSQLDLLRAGKGEEAGAQITRMYEFYLEQNPS